MRENSTRVVYVCMCVCVCLYRPIGAHRPKSLPLPPLPLFSSSEQATQWPLLSPLPPPHGLLDSEAAAATSAVAAMAGWLPFSLVGFSLFQAKFSRARF